MAFYRERRLRLSRLHIDRTDRWRKPACIVQLHRGRHAECPNLHDQWVRLAPAATRRHGLDDLQSRRCGGKRRHDMEEAQPADGRRARHRGDRYGLRQLSRRLQLDVCRFQRRWIGDSESQRPRATDGRDRTWRARSHHLQYLGKHGGVLIFGGQKLTTLDAAGNPYTQARPATQAKDLLDDINADGASPFELRSTALVTNRAFNDRFGVIFKYP